LDDHVRDAAKLANKDGKLMYGAPLMQKAFSQEGVFGLSDDKEIQSGYASLFVGAIKALKNDYSHYKDADPGSPARAFEWLALASALLRLVDEATRLVPKLDT
jgi:hypothetical protein